MSLSQEEFNKLKDTLSRRKEGLSEQSFADLKNQLKERKEGTKERISKFKVESEKAKEESEQSSGFVNIAQETGKGVVSRLGRLSGITPTAEKIAGGVAPFVTPEEELPTVVEELAGGVETPQPSKIGEFVETALDLPVISLGLGKSIASKLAKSGLNIAPEFLTREISSLLPKFLKKEVPTSLGEAKKVASDFLERRATKNITKQEEKAFNFAQEFVEPKLSKKAKEEAISRGMVDEAGIFRKAKVKPSPRDELIAESVMDVIDPKLSAEKNIDLINTEITKLDRGIKDMLFDRKIPFNESQLRSQLNAVKGDSRIVFASDKTAERTFDAIVDTFVDSVRKKDTLGVFEARQNFDQIPAIKKLLQSEGLGENVRRELVLDVRRAANNYVDSLLPENSPFKAILQKENRMFEALSNHASRNYSKIDKNKIQQLAQEYPILKWIIGGTAAGILGGAGVGVGSTIIGSTD